MSDIWTCLTLVRSLEFRLHLAVAEFRYNGFSPLYFVWNLDVFRLYRDIQCFGNFDKSCLCVRVSILWNSMDFQRLFFREYCSKSSCSQVSSRSASSICSSRFSFAFGFLCFARFLFGQPAVISFVLFCRHVSSRRLFTDLPSTTWLNRHREASFKQN